MRAFRMMMTGATLAGTSHRCRVVAYYVVCCLVLGVCLGEIAFAFHAFGRRPPFISGHSSSFRAVLQDVSVTASDAVVLRGWFARPASGNGDASFFCTGSVITVKA